MVSTANVPNDRLFVGEVIQRCPDVVFKFLRHAFDNVVERKFLPAFQKDAQDRCF